jgi:hypothetical protein
MSPAAVAALLADEAFNFETHAPAALRAIGALASRVPAFDLEFDDLRTAVDAIEAALRDTAARTNGPDCGATHSARAPNGLCVELLDGEAVIWDPARRELHHLNRLTTIVWCAYLDGGAAAAIDTAAEDARPTVERCLADLAAAGLLGATAPAQA